MFTNCHSGVRSMCIVFASSWLLSDARERLTSQEVAGYVVQTLGVGVYQYSRLLAQHHQHQPEAARAQQMKYMATAERMVICPATKQLEFERMHKKAAILITTQLMVYEWICTFSRKQELVSKVSDPAKQAPPNRPQPYSVETRPAARSDWKIPL